jgi:hypothetical protein
MKITLSKNKPGWTRYRVSNYEPPLKFKEFKYKGWRVLNNNGYPKGVTIGANQKVIILSTMTYLERSNPASVNTTDKQAFEEINEAIKLAYKQ